MKLWLDNHLPPALCTWMKETFSIEAEAVRDLGMSRASDEDVFAAAAAAGATIMTKDADFVELLERRGPPPQIVLLTFGNTSTPAAKHILTARLPAALALLAAGEPLVEIARSG
ncbi:MAG: DUF5615 family PIN-like protein [Hyphomonadaceae bacterium]